MKIAIISDFNIAGQPTALMRAINKYTDHEARCIIANDDSFQYDRDLFLDTEESREEAAAFCNQADFFHFGRGIFNWPGVDFNKLLRRDNCCIKYYGSELRENWKAMAEYHRRTGLPAITGTDWTITGRMLGSFYHLGSYFTRFGDLIGSEIPMVSQNGSGPMRICAGSAGNPNKGYDILAQVVEELRTDGLKIELDFISGVSNAVCLERKEKYQVTFTSLNGGWGISGVESMYLGHIVIGNLDPWVLSMYPDQPSIIASRSAESLRDKIREVYWRTVEEKAEVGQKGREFAIRNFSTRTILKKYLYLFDLIMNGDRYLEGGHAPKRIYDDF